MDYCNINNLSNINMVESMDDNTSSMELLDEDYYLVCEENPNEEEDSGVEGKIFEWVDKAKSSEWFANNGDKFIVFLRGCLNGEIPMNAFFESMQTLLTDSCVEQQDNEDGNDTSNNNNNNNDNNNNSPFAELLQLFVLADPTTKMIDYLCSKVGQDGPSFLQNFSTQNFGQTETQSEGMVTSKKKRVRKHTSKGIRRPPNKWTKEESERLIGLVERMGDKKWKKIAQSFGVGKTGAQCAQHWKRVLCPVIRKGAWEVDEEEQLFALVEKHGQAWKKVASELVNRTDIQCRYQYLKAIESINIPWSHEEETLLIHKAYECGTQAGGIVPWIDVSRHVAKGKHTKIPRTALECRSKYQSLISSFIQNNNDTNQLPTPQIQITPEFTQTFVQLSPSPIDVTQYCHIPLQIDMSNIVNRQALPLG